MAFAFAVGFAVDGRAATDERAAAFVLCKSKKDVRTIRVISDARGSSCMTMYTKAGQDKLMGGNRSLAACKTVLKTIRNNLEAAQWNCRTVESAQVMMGDDVVR